MQLYQHWADDCPIPEEYLLPDCTLLSIRDVWSGILAIQFSDVNSYFNIPYYRKDNTQY